jgi:predicted aspartyl protease
MPTKNQQQYQWARCLISSCLFVGLSGIPATLAHELQPDGTLEQGDRLTVVAPSAIAQTQAIVQLQGLPLSPPKIQGQAKVPFQAEVGLRLLTIEGQVQNQPETFLVDTGASTSLLSKSLVERLKLEGRKIAGDRLSSAVAGTDCPNMDANLHTVPSMTIGTLQVQQWQGLEFLNRKLPYGLSGILGMNLLSAFDLTIYPKLRQLGLTSPSSLPIEEKDLSIPLQRRLGVMLTELTINQQGPFTFLLDTGAAVTFVSPKVAQATQLTEQPRQSVKVQGFCGLEPAYQVMAPMLKLGRYQVPQVETVVIDSAVIQSLKVDGVLGQNVLNRFDQHWRFPNPQRSDSQAQGSLSLRLATSSPDE